MNHPPRAIMDPQWRVNRTNAPTVEIQIQIKYKYNTNTNTDHGPPNVGFTGLLHPYFNDNLSSNNIMTHNKHIQLNPEELKCVHE